MSPMSPERRGILLLLSLAVAGQGLRAWLSAPSGVPPGELAVVGAPRPSSPRAHRDSSVARAGPLGADERIDLDRAAAAEIARLPRIGPALARAIVADREARGPFGSLEGLDRVSGVGPGLLAAIAPHARFSGAAGLPAPLPSAAPAAPAAGLDDAPLDLNDATVEELERLPHLGPYMARQVVAFRERHGPFPALDSLVRVPGIGPATLARIRDRLRVGP